jgi:transcriptional regulator GlxA family with amidase domain
VEYAILTEERRHSSENESGVVASMTAGLNAFDDALLALEAVQDIAGYKVADKTWPHSSKYRVHDMPNDALHITCKADLTRIENTLRTPGINPTERELYDQRKETLTAIRDAYQKRQEAALAIDK